MPGQEEITLPFRKRALLVGQQFERRVRIQSRVVPLPAHDGTVLIVLDQAVIGIRRERQRAEPQGVEDGQVEQIETRGGGPQVGQVEDREVVSDETLGAFREPVQFGERRGQLAGLDPAAGEGSAVLVYRRERVDAPVARPDLEVEGKEPHGPPTSPSNPGGPRQPPTMRA